MRSTKHNGLIAAALIMGLGAGLPAVANTTRRSSGSPAKPMRVVRKTPTEIEAWNADVDKRESHYITALVELRRQMTEMQNTITRIIEGRPAIRTAPAVAGEFKIPPIRSVFDLGDES